MPLYRYKFCILEYYSYNIKLHYKIPFLFLKKNTKYDRATFERKILRGIFRRGNKSSEKNDRLGEPSLSTCSTILIFYAAF